MDTQPAPAPAGAARRARARKKRSQARHVAWLMETCQVRMSHHTSPDAGSAIGNRFKALEAKVAELTALLQLHKDTTARAQVQKDLVDTPETQGHDGVKMHDCVQDDAHVTKEPGDEPLSATKSGQTFTSTFSLPPKALEHAEACVEHEEGDAARPHSPRPAATSGDGHAADEHNVNFAPSDACDEPCEAMLRNISPVEGQALALTELQQAQTEFDRLAGVAFAKNEAAEAAQQELAATQDALDIACIRFRQAKAAFDAAEAFCTASAGHGWHNT